ncbi:tRNA (adenosine(37)-N6)-dimethylallyltransferase MiaA [bacterium]|nr:MAG: tRNA (adenosine(37)-N6)-dimethylallyltransferase MiaA [bacterium]
MSNSNTKKPLVVILGPTASGKTGWAMKLCQKFSTQGGGEIVSADSRQIYRGMDIGTAKTRELGIKNTELRIDDGINQHLVDIVDPDESFTLSDYKKLAIEKINDIHDRGKVPFLVGGTGLYISAIVDNLDIPEVAPDKKLRAELEKKSTQDLQTELKNLDPISYEKIDLNNRRRLIRAIEVCEITGEPFSSLRKKGEPLFNVLQIGIHTDKKVLDGKINRRVDEMIANGLVDEVKKLSTKYSSDLPSMSGIGYAELNVHFNAHLTLEQAIDLIKVHTRQYAKKQMTWFRRDDRIRWISDYDEAELLVKRHLCNNDTHCLN